MVGTVASPVVSAAIFAISVVFSARSARRARVERLSAATRVAVTHALKHSTLSHGLGYLTGWPYELLLRTAELAAAIDIKLEHPVAKWLMDGVPQIVQDFDSESRGRKVGAFLAMLVVLEDTKGRPLKKALRACLASPWSERLPDLPRWRKIVRAIREWTHALRAPTTMRH